MQILLAILSGIAVAAVLILAVQWLRRRVQLVDRLSFPLTVAAVAAGLKVVTLFPIGTMGGLDRILFWTLVFVGSILAIRVAGLYFFDVYLHDARGVRLPPLLPTVILGIAYLITAFVVLKQVYNYNLGPLLATSAVTSLVLGLALQPILGNFFSGLVISLEKPFRINDWINFEGTDARVTDITWRTTHLRTRDNDNLVVPNTEIANSRILNYYYPHPLHLERIYVGVHYRTPPYRVKQAMLDVADRIERVLKKPSPAVYLFEFGDSAITYRLRVWIEDIARQPMIASYIKSELWEEFRRRGITIPFPIRTLEIEPRVNTLRLDRARREVVEDGKPTPARLYVARGPDRGKRLRLDRNVPAVAGRSSNCEFTLIEAQASKEHFRVDWREDRYVLTDLDSSNGTIINGETVTEQVLRDFDRITIGDTVIVFEDHGR